MTRVFSLNDANIPDLAVEFQAGPGGWQARKSSFAIAKQHIAFAGVKAAELGQESEIIAAKNQVGEAIAIQIETLDRIDRR